MLGTGSGLPSYRRCLSELGAKDFGATDEDYQIRWWWRYEQSEGVVE